LRVFWEQVEHATTMTEQIEIVESNSQSISDDDSGSDLSDGDVAEKVERRIYKPIEFDLNDPNNTFVVDFLSLQPPDQSKVRSEIIISQ